MSLLVVRDADFLDARYLAEHMRGDDRLELEATSPGCNPLDRILLSMRRSDFCYAAEFDGKLVCMGGALALGNGEAWAWMLGTKHVEDNWREFARQSKAHILPLLSHYSVVYNFIDLRYKKCIGWLLWLGFEIGSDPFPLPPSGLPFVKMMLRNRPCAN
jgi:hypothetical protein